MEIRDLVETYTKNADAFYAAIAGETHRKNAIKPTPPDYMREVIVPVLNELIRRLPECRLNPPDESYAMRCDYYYIQFGKLSVGGLQPDERYHLTFTPLSKKKPAGPRVPIETFDLLAAQVKRAIAAKKSNKPTTVSTTTSRHE